MCALEKNKNKKQNKPLFNESIYCLTEKKKYINLEAERQCLFKVTQNKKKYFMSFNHAVQFEVIRAKMAGTTDTAVNMGKGKKCVRII